MTATAPQIRPKITVFDGSSFGFVPLVDNLVVVVVVLNLVVVVVVVVVLTSSPRRHR